VPALLWLAAWEMCMRGDGMTFKAALQNICNEHNVKVMPGVTIEGGKIIAVLGAYKLDDDGKVIAQYEIGAVGPERKE